LREAAAFAPDPAAFVATWREKQLAYAFASAIMHRHEDFDAMTAHAARFAAAKHGVPMDENRCEMLVRAWERVQPYPDAIPALTALRASSVPCAVLTNGAPATSAAAIVNAGLEDMLDVTLSVEQAGVYKPDRRVYSLVTGHYGLDAERFIFVTANGWDATGAAAFGMRVVWCNRSGAPGETYGPAPERTIADLRELSSIVAVVASS
jgi:2-haloacid dehalogenase